MKSILLTITFFSAILFPLYSQIPNNDFENWTDAGFWEELDGWFSNYGDLIPVCLQKSTDAYSGAYAAHLDNSLINSYMYSDFTISSHPHSLTAYVKGNVGAGDSVYINVILYQDGSAVDSGKWTGYTTISSYTQVLATISTSFPTANSAHIYISGGTENTSDLLIDLIQFDVAQGINDLNTGGPKFYAMENPFYGQLNLLTSFSSEASLKFTDINGQIYFTGEIAPGINHLSYDMSYLPPGMYFCMVKEGDQLHALKVIKQ